MLPCKSESFTFHRNNSTNSSDSSTRSAGMQHCRRKLQDKFDQTDKGNENESKTQIGDRSVLSVLSLNDSTRRVLRNGAERITKTFNTVRTTFGTISQRSFYYLSSITCNEFWKQCRDSKYQQKRRQILEEGPMTPSCATPHTFSKHILGRTPTKLYSPFGIESPYSKSTTYDKENLPPKCHQQLFKF
ncbi:hypothetical protein NQ314_000350 [Rhamnusium bicolor]|uniref:Uncharacterized protein n=1 Tax=Rhamnusium bicolor TaxID=1586634 RepID=A0AAV8ZWF2_9CUCU|nr:hypothetical protein NQ314_000350 [Rhamnusium bicolor]